MRLSALDSDPQVERDALQRGLAWLGPEHRTCAPLFGALQAVVRAWGGECALLV